MDSDKEDGYSDIFNSDSEDGDFMGLNLKEKKNPTVVRVNVLVIGLPIMLI